MSFVGRWVTMNYDVVGPSLDGPARLEVQQTAAGLKGTWGDPTDPACAQLTGELQCDGQAWAGTWGSTENEGVFAHRGTFTFVLDADGEHIHGAWALGDGGPPQPWWGRRDG